MWSTAGIGSITNTFKNMNNEVGQIYECVEVLIGQGLGYWQCHECLDFNRLQILETVYCNDICNANTPLIWHIIDVKHE